MIFSLIVGSMVSSLWVNHKKDFFYFLFLSATRNLTRSCCCLQSPSCWRNHPTHAQVDQESTPASPKLANSPRHIAL
ncbi:hypothetical protein VTO42DRAFT_7564 [Malbranchea cinnamomea]